MKNRWVSRGRLALVALFVLLQVSGAWAGSGSGDAVRQEVSASPNAPAITVWYGDTQKFGVLGNPQKQINILGNVTDATTLEYSLNGGTYKALSIGSGASAAAAAPGAALQSESASPQADNKRLVREGDFNIEILTSQLSTGANTVSIRATGDGETTKVVTVDYTPGKTWPMPYTLDWNDFDTLQEVLDAGKAQVVDGEWYLSEEEGTTWLRTADERLGYERTVALGDIKWKDFDVLVPLWLKEFPIDDEGYIGIMLRWQGHIQDEAGEQPLTGWWKSGALGVFRHRVEGSVSDCGSRLEMYYSQSGMAEDEDCDPKVRRSAPSYFRMRVQTTGTAPYGVFGFKVWPIKEDEPEEWELVQEDELPDALETGSLLLVAHEADVRFGKVEVRPFVTLQTSVDGAGQVQVSPEIVAPPDAYILGQTVQLTAVPDDPDTVAFAGWSGDLTGAANPATLTLDKTQTSVKAAFAPKQTLTVTASPSSAGSVDLDPPGGEYGQGVVVTLTPNPDSGWGFSSWSGPNQADVVDLGDGSWTITMDADKSLTANFARCYTLTRQVSPLDSGTILTEPEPQCGEDGFWEDVTVQLTASPGPCFAFSSWDDDASGAVNPTSITMDDDKTVTAIFTALPPPAVPVHTSPASGSSSCDPGLTFEWEAVTGATQYEILISDANTTLPAVEAAVPGPTYSLATALTPGPYNWQVRASDGCLWSAWTAPWPFTALQSPPVPGLVSPADGTITGGLQPTFAWSSTEGALAYQVQADDDPSFASPAVDQPTAATSYMPTAPLAPGDYSWRARGVYDCGNGGWATPYKLTLLGGGPGLKFYLPVLARAAP